MTQYGSVSGIPFTGNSVDYFRVDFLNFINLLDVTFCDVGCLSVVLSSLLLNQELVQGNIPQIFSHKR